MRTLKRFICFFKGHQYLVSMPVPSPVEFTSIAKSMGFECSLGCIRCGKRFKKTIGLNLARGIWMEDIHMKKGVVLSGRGYDR